MAAQQGAGLALRRHGGRGGIGRWIAEQPWEPAPGGGWTVPADLHGWRFRLEPVAGGVRVVMSVGGGGPAEWTVPAAKALRMTAGLGTLLHHPPRALGAPRRRPPVRFVPRPGRTNACAIVPIRLASAWVDCALATSRRLYHP
jgi:hypothetical protein